MDFHTFNPTNILVFLLLLYFLLPVTVCQLSSSAAGSSPKHFRVDLDTPPRERWVPVLEAFNGTDVIPRIVHAVRLYLPEKVRSPLYWIFGKLTRFLPHEYAEELKGMADHLRDQGVTLGDLVVLNLFYDLFDFALPLLNHSAPLPFGCTSILTADRDGHILHGRNLDFGWTRLLRDTTILVDYVRAGTVQFTGVQFLLHNGLLTGQRAGAFTVSLNARYSGGPLDNVLMELLTRFHHPVAYELRKVLDSVADYPTAVEKLNQVPMIASSYIIVGGNSRGDGAIITRDRLGPADVYSLDYLHHQWYLVEDNDDPWKRTADKRNQTVFSTVMSAQRPDLIYNYTHIWTN